jgi:hypothetical protein
MKNIINITVFESDDNFVQGREVFSEAFNYLPGNAIAKYLRLPATVNANNLKTYKLYISMHAPIPEPGDSPFPPMPGEMVLAVDDAEREAMSEYMNLDKEWVWLTNVTARSRRIGIEAGCTGSSHCAAAIHIERPDGNRASQEIHLTTDEIKHVRKLLKAALRMSRDGVVR